MKSATTKSLSFVCKLFHSVPKCLVLVRLPFAPQRIAAQTDEISSAALTQPKADYDIDRSLSPRLGRQKFFATTAFKA